MLASTQVSVAQQSPVTAMKELDLQLASALARVDEAAAGPLMAGGTVWTHVNAGKTDNKEAVFEPWRSEGFYTWIEPYDITARDYGTFVVVTGSSRIDAAYKGTRFSIDFRPNDVWKSRRQMAHGGSTHHE